MSEDCKNCGTMMWLVDSEGLCPSCNGLGFDEDGEPIYDPGESNMSESPKLTQREITKAMRELDRLERDEIQVV